MALKSTVRPARSYFGSAVDVIEITAIARRFAVSVAADKVSKSQGVSINSRLKEDLITAIAKGLTGIGREKSSANCTTP